MKSADPLTHGEVTRLLDAARGGERDVLERVIPLLYDQLRNVAMRQLRGEAGALTLNPTDLVHEAYFKLSDDVAGLAANRAHFLAIASRAMRQVLVDRARRRNAGKRGASWDRVTLTDERGTSDMAPEELLALDEALERLDPRQRQVVECRFFGGMEETEIAQALGVSERTVRRDWVKARAWLYRELYREAPE